MHENRSAVGSLEVIWMKRPPVKLSIKPTQYSNLGRAEGFEPAIDQKVSTD